MPATSSEGATRRTPRSAAAEEEVVDSVVSTGAGGPAVLPEPPDLPSSVTNRTIATAPPTSSSEPAKSAARTASQRRRRWSDLVAKRHRQRLVWKAVLTTRYPMAMSTAEATDHSIEDLPRTATCGRSLTNGRGQVQAWQAARPVCNHALGGRLRTR